MNETERFAWLQLAFTPYVGAESFLILLRYFGSTQAALDAPAEKIAALVRHKQRRQRLGAMPKSATWRKNPPKPP